MATVHSVFQDRSMTVGYVCQRDVDTAERAEKVNVAAQRMESRCVGSLVVVGDGGRPAGILTDRDIAIRVVAQRKDPGRTTVGEVMSRSPCTVPDTASVGEALVRMTSAKVRRLPVVDEEEQLVGVVCLDDVLRLHARELRSIAELIDATAPSSLAEMG